MIVKAHNYGSGRGFVGFLDRLDYASIDARTRVELQNIDDCQTEYYYITHPAGIFAQFNVSPDRYPSEIKPSIDFHAEHTDELWFVVQDFRLMTLTLSTLVNQPVISRRLGGSRTRTIPPGLIGAYNSIGSQLTAYAKVLDLRNSGDTSRDNLLTAATRVSQAVNPQRWDQPAFTDEAGRPIIPATDISANLYLHALASQTAQ
jgi:hypothetical protein